MKRNEAGKQVVKTVSFKTISTNWAAESFHNSDEFNSLYLKGETEEISWRLSLLQNDHWRDGAPLQNDWFSRKWPHARHYFGYKMLAQIRFVEQFIVEISREIHQKSMTAVELWLDLSSIQLGSTKIQTSSAAGLKMAPPCQPSMQSRLSVLSLSPYATRCHRHPLAVELLQADSERAEQQLLAWLQLLWRFALWMHSGLWKPCSKYL